MLALSGAKPPVAIVPKVIHRESKKFAPASISIIV